MELRVRVKNRESISSKLEEINSPSFSEKIKNSKPEKFCCRICRDYTYLVVASYKMVTRYFKFFLYTFNYNILVFKAFYFCYEVKSLELCKSNSTKFQLFLRLFPEKVVSGTGKSLYYWGFNTQPNLTHTSKLLDIFCEHLYQ